MSLISQHALRKHRREESNGSEEGDGSPVTGEAEAVQEEEPSSERASKEERRRRRRKKRAEATEESLKAREARQRQDEEEMRQLESSLFGAIHAPLEFGTEAAGEAAVAAQDAPLFFVDTFSGDAQNDLVVYEEDLPRKGEGDVAGAEGRKPAWFDDDEETAQVDILKVGRLRKLRKEADERVISGREYVARLRGQHAKLNPFTGWAQLDRIGSRAGVSDDESDYGSGVEVAHGYGDVGGDDILRNTDELVVGDSAKLLPGILEFSRLVDANAEEPSNGPINSVQFHRNGQLMLAAGLDKKLRFFQVDGKRNPKIQSIFVADCPVHKASFLPDGSEVILAGRRKFFYSFDLVKAAVSKIGPLTGREEKSLESFEVSPDSSTIAFIGNEGHVLLISSRTKELIGNLKMNGTARSLAFADGGNQLLSSGGDGHVYHWDLRTMRCIHKGVDEGSLGGISLCTSPDSSLFATGSTSGIVNVYKRDEFLGGKRMPLKTIENLTTEVGEMKFNHDAQVLAISSRKERNGLRLVHVPSFNVFSNWPGPRFSLKYPRCLDFSPGSGFMAVGNAAGTVLLYKLHHYKNA